VLLDRAILVTERARQSGGAIDSAMLAHLRMTRQARDLIAAGDIERAADLLERAIAINDGAGFGYLYLGYVHLRAGRRDQADVFLDRAAALLPPDPALRVEIEQLRARADVLSTAPHAIARQLAGSR
jgi:Flp pilus assembly protein TadD